MKFVPHGSLACKRACGGGYLSGGKRQAYHAGKTPNQPPIILSLPSNQALLIPRSCRVYNLGPPLTLKPTAQLVFSDGKNPRDTAFSFSCVVSSSSEWHHSYTRESDAAHSAAKGGGFLPPKNASSTIRAQQAA